MAEDAKPPYVRFEVRSVEDRNATIEAGHYVGVDTIFACVTAPGTRDELEKVADDWIANLEEGVKQERIPGLWLEHFRRSLEAFKNGQELPVEGTPIRTWPPITPTELKLLTDISVHTVEQLADANEETVNRIGMGGRALKQKARAWLDASASTGKVTEELNALRVANKELKERDEAREKELKKLSAQVETLTKAAKEPA